MTRSPLRESRIEAITMARIAPEKSNFFVRCNYDVGAPGKVSRSTGRHEQDLKGAAQGFLALVGQAITRVEQGDEGEAALRDLRASLLEIRGLRARDPGIRTASQDLFEAAAALVLDDRAGVVVVDIRRRRLLNDAHLRLRRRLEG